MVIATNIEKLVQKKPRKPARAETTIDFKGTFKVDPWLIEEAKKYNIPEKKVLEQVHLGDTIYGPENYYVVFIENEIGFETKRYS